MRSGGRRSPLDSSGLLRYGRQPALGVSAPQTPSAGIAASPWRAFALDAGLPGWTATRAATPVWLGGCISLKTFFGNICRIDLDLLSYPALLGVIGAGASVSVAWSGRFGISTLRCRLRSRAGSAVGTSGDYRTWWWPRQCARRQFFCPRLVRSHNFGHFAAQRPEIRGRKIGEKRSKSWRRRTCPGANRHLGAAVSRSADGQSPAPSGSGRADHPRAHGLVRRLIDQDEAARAAVSDIRVEGQRRARAQPHPADVVELELRRRR